MIADKRSQIKAYPRSLPPGRGEDTIHPLPILVEMTKHEGEVIDHKGAESLHFVVALKLQHLGVHSSGGSGHGALG